MLRRLFPTALVTLVVAVPWFAGGAAPAQGAIVELAHFDLGEPGSINGASRPVDAINGGVFTNGSVILPPVAVSKVPGSTAALQFDGIRAVFGASGINAFPSDNFILELFARTSTPDRDTTMFATNISGVWLSMADGHWTANVRGTILTGSEVSAGQWTSLALIRENGVSTFYVNGEAQSGTTTANPNINSTQLHLGIPPGGGLRFVGEIDQVRFLSFNPATDDPESALLAPVPEPSTVVLSIAGIALVSCSAFRRRRARNSLLLKDPS